MSSTETTAVQAAAQWQLKEQEERQAIVALEQQLAPLKSRQQRASFYGLNDPSLRKEAQTIGAEIQRIEGEIQVRRQALSEIEATLTGMSAEILRERLAQAEADYAAASHEVYEIERRLAANRSEWSELQQRMREQSQRANTAFQLAARLRNESKTAERSAAPA